MPTDDQLIGKAPVIVEGRVVSTSAVEVDGRIWTETVVAVDRTLKGKTEQTIVVREIGGELDGRITKVFGTPEFKDSERVLLFLEPAAQGGGYRTVDLFVGKFRSAWMMDGGRLWYRTDATEPVTLLDHDFQPLAASNVQRDATKFEEFVVERVAGRPGLRNYGIANPVLAREQSARGIQSNFTLISEPTVYRWSMFDTGQTANWYSGGTQTGYSGGGVTELQTAMSAWTSYGQAKIFYSYAGTRSGSFGGLTTRNGVNEVLFDDPNSEITGTFSRTAGGVVGTGGFNGVTSGGNWTSPFAFDAAHPQGSMRVYNIVEGNLTIQDGVTPTNGISSTRLAEIISHEFGHTLGFGHSPDGSALMYANVTGRGPSLRDDDQIAARWLYPNGNVTPPPPAVPAAPTGVSATASASSITVEWSDNANNETGFSIYLSNGGTFAKAADVGANTTRATLNGLVAGTYRAYVVAFNANGESPASNTAMVTIAGTTLTAGFTFTPQTGTAGVTTFTFYDESRGASTRLWNFGDGTTSTAAVVNKNYARAGQYTVTLTVTGTAGNTAQHSEVVNVSAPLAASFTFTPANPTTNDTINFVDQSTGGVTSWRWVFGDGESSNGQNPSKRYSTPSTFTVTLSVFRNSESATYTTTITVRNPAPAMPAVTADFDFAPSTPAAGTSVTFNDRSTGGPTSWSWSFGDGRTSSARHPVIAFSAPGTYTVTLIASNGSSSGTSSREVSVAANVSHRSLVSVTTQTNGVGGTAWRTELTVFNAGAQGASVTLLFIPGTGGTAITRNLFLSPRQSVTYANTLLELFGVPNGAGAVAIEATSSGSSAQLRISSRTYTDGTRGTYGQAVPDVVSLDKTLYITGMQSSAGFRTNVGLVNRGDADMAATLTLYNASGSTVGTSDIVVPARHFQQAPLASFFPAIAGRSYDVLSMRIVAASPESLSAYASVIDNKTQDPIYVQAMPASTGSALTLPVVGRSPGVNGTFWRSDVSVFNPSSDRLNFTVRYGTDSKSMSLGARDTVVLADVLSEFGLTSGQGALTMSWSGANGPVVTSRTYTSTEAGGTFGQSIDPAIAFASEVFVPGLRSDASYRSNIGFVNGGDETESFDVVLLSSSGTELASVQYALAPGGQAQTSLRGLFPNVSENGNFTLALRGDSNARLFAYGSMVDNLSGDPVFFAGR